MKVPRPALFVSGCIPVVLALGSVAAESPQSPVPREPIVPPQIIIKSQAAPEYPPAARAARFEGAVTVELKVLKTGVVESVKVVECTHKNVGFEDAAVSAAKQWRFEPAKRGAVPVDYTTRFRLHFRIPGRGDEYVTATGVDDARLRPAQPPTRTGAK